MTVQQKITPFVAPAGNRSLEIEFESWMPDRTLGAAQMDANRDWKGSSLKPILADAALAHVPLPQILEHMIRSCWKSATVSDGAARGRITIGGTTHHVDGTGQRVFGGRQLSHDLLRSSGSQADQARAQAQVMAGRHVRQVQPLVTQEAAGAAAAPLRQMPHLQGIATDWKTMNELQRVNAYTFRGDTRAPAAIAAAGGFSPPISRTDAYYVDNVVKPAFRSYMKRRYGQDVSDADATRAVNQAAPANSAERHVLSNYFVWRLMTENESMHIGRMLADEALKGYISTSRAVSVARAFARANGWVYLTRVRGGFLVPDKGSTTWTQIFGEQEIALPGKLGWDDVFGFRQLDANSRLAGPIYFRKGFAAQRIAFAEAYDLLSGKRQG